MSMRTILLVVILLGGGSLAWFSLGSGEPAPQAPINDVRHILVANQPLQAGTLLKDADFREKEVASSKVPDESFADDDSSRAELRGSMLRRYLDVGEIVRQPDVLRPRDRGFLAAVLAPGTRAVTIGVDATTGASGLISPGDLVDVILSQEFERGNQPVGRRVVAETVLSKVRVIAVDQQIAQGAAAPSLVGSVGQTRVASTVSLQVTPEDAAKVVVAERLGRLTLVVRSIDAAPADRTPIAEASPASPAGHSGVEPPAPAQTSVFGSDVSAALAGDQPAANPKLRIIQGDAVNDVVFR